MSRFSKRSLEGELVIDHRNSPGVSEAFLRTAGLQNPIIVPGGALYESPTAMCAHCGATVVLSPTRQRPRGHCGKCDAYICDHPICNRECTPHEAALDAIRNHVERTGLLPPPEEMRRLMPRLFDTGENLNG